MSVPHVSICSCPSRPGSRRARPCRGHAVAAAVGCCAGDRGTTGLRTTRRRNTGHRHARPRTAGAAVDRCAGCRALRRTQHTRRSRRPGCAAPPRRRPAHLRSARYRTRVDPQRSRPKRCCRTTASNGSTAPDSVCSRTTATRCAARAPRPGPTKRAVRPGWRNLLDEACERRSFAARRAFTAGFPEAAAVPSASISRPKRRTSRRGRAATICGLAASATNSPRPACARAARRRCRNRAAR